MPLLARHATGRVRAALADTPVVVVHGPRQSGKSTLVRELLDGDRRTYLTFDDLVVRAAAARDPEGFLAGLAGPVALDEAQRVPDLVVAIKAAVDRDRTPGRFLLTGSADVFARTGSREGLAGRRETVPLWPLTQSEIEQVPRIDLISLFDDDLQVGDLPEVAPADMRARVLAGGYPEARLRSQARRHAWFRAYLDEVARFEIAERSAIEGLLEIPTMLRLLAIRSAGLLNVARLAADLGVSPRTADRYLTLLTETFLVQRVPAWTRSPRKRLVKSPKVVVADSGLAAYLADVGAETFARAPERVGPLVEGMVLAELRSLCDADPAGPTLWHFRTESQREVDAVLEDGSGRVVGIEVKAGRTVRSTDFRGLEALADAAGPRFVRGIVLHPGHQVVPFGPRLAAVPISLLWAPS